jgi:hypothetical protein
MNNLEDLDRISHQNEEELPAFIKANKVGTGIVIYQ